MPCSCPWPRGERSAAFGARARPSGSRSFSLPPVPWSSSSVPSPAPSGGGSKRWMKRSLIPGTPSPAGHAKHLGHVLVAAPRQVHEHQRVAAERVALAQHPGERVRRLERRQDPLEPCERLERLERLGVGDAVVAREPLVV